MIKMLEQRKDRITKDEIMELKRKIGMASQSGY